MPSAQESHSSYDFSFKIVLVGDSGVGKSSLVLTYMSKAFKEKDSTIGVDIDVTHVTIREKKLKLTFWDTAGQERYRTLPGHYYRDAKGIILVYDVTRRETFTNLSLWTKEVELYSTNQDCIKTLVGNKVDKESERVVTREEGIAFAQKHGCSFLECSARTQENVEKCFEELSLKIVDRLEPKKPEPKKPEPTSGGCCN